MYNAHENNPKYLAAVRDLAAAIEGDLELRADGPIGDTWGSFATGGFACSYTYLVNQLDIVFGQYGVKGDYRVRMSFNADIVNHQWVNKFGDNHRLKTLALVALMIQTLKEITG